MTEARACYEQGLAAATKMQHRPEIALTRLQMAELCVEEVTSPPAAASPSPPVERGPGGEVGALRQEALDHLDFYISEFREMQMAPSLERALRLKAQIGA